ncbi:glycosyltransferase [Thauera sp. CAU 1555]|uniref:Glycosyltransferase n=1 Tax=Thauera sedimentorum TaxID=2767595 RepID=A0ABR9B5Z7_9RHOO|nr:glycosyltransferase [Thauera sedimentorum]MBC9070399.1 glycosyltransferase [Thauera sedimentorum]MBD8501319.1 glycosyltransferase [Thauera sedimentorum]
MLDVIVPVYAGEADTRRCLESVLACRQQTMFELVVVDDASPEPTLSAWLQELADAGQISLLRNPYNLGFVRTVNRALALHPGRDVVLLNSDTEVSGNWLDRILRCADSHPDAATITPFSNNATICSYPYEGWLGEVPGRLGLAALDEVFSRRLSGVAMDLPSGVGFCMFVRRACLDAVGVLDDVAFARGYGEENDLCRRAAKAGWRNLLCADVFVYHRGGVSFAHERGTLMKQGDERLNALHPEYAEVVRRFIVDDPLRPLRDAIDAARAALGADEAAEVSRERERRPPLPAREVLWQDTAPHVGMDVVNVPAVNSVAARPLPDEVWLHVAHSWGGGVMRWVHDLAGADAGEARHLLLRSRSWRNHAGVRLELVDPMLADEVLIAWTLDGPIGYCDTEHAQYREILADLIAAFDVRAVVVSSLIGHSLDALDTGLPTFVVLHDLFPFCPALFGWFEQTCVECGPSSLARCFASNPLNVFWQHADVKRWQALRTAYGARLADESVMIVAPSRSVHERYVELFPLLRGRSWRLIAHGLASVPVPLLPRPAERLKLLVPGRLAPHKGLDLLREVLPGVSAFADVMLLGCGEFGRAFAGQPNVQVVESYSQAQMAAHVAAFGPDCALLLSSLPETFSYTLSEMHALGVPVLASDLGAFSERIVDGQTGYLVVPEAAVVIARLYDMARDRRALAEMAGRLRQQPVHTAGQMVAEYRALLPQRKGEAAIAPRKVLTLLSMALADARCRQRSTMAQLLEARREVSSHQFVLESLARERARNAYVENDLAGRLELVEAERDALLASTSWKLTAPLRLLKGELSRRTLPATTLDSTRAKQEPHLILATMRGDLMAERRRKRLLAACGMKQDDQLGSVASASDMGGIPFRGMALYLDVLRSGNGGDTSVVLCLESAEGLSRDRSIAGVCRVVVPTAALATELMNLLEPDAATVVQADYPLVGDWDGDWAPYVADVPAAQGLRKGLREVRRDMLGLPDGSRIVIGCGAGGAGSGLLQFAHAAMAVGNRHNGVFFVWLGQVDEAWADAQGDSLALPQALRRLFILDDPAFEPWLLAADLYLGCRQAPGHDAGALEAHACGLPVVSLETEIPVTEPDLVRELWQRLTASFESGSADMTTRLRRAARLREERGSMGAWAAFAATCGVRCTDVQPG